jgi:hypothetical protein
MDNTNPLTGRWKREATEAEIRRIRGEKDLDYVEWRLWNQTFFLSLKELIIVRTNILGGDVADVQGGWRYDNDILIRADWEEIRRVGADLERQFN